MVRLFPRGSRERVAGAGERAWRTLISYVHATLAVAFVDAVGIGLGAAILGVPLALPLAVLVFLFSFIPIVGATLSGLIAVLVALVAKGPVTALILLGVVLLVQQLEGHVLQPLLLGRAVKVHPLAIVFAIATGMLLAGIIGALVAVPIVAVVATVSGLPVRRRTARELVPTDTRPAHAEPYADGATARVPESRGAVDRGERDVGAEVAAVEVDACRAGSYAASRAAASVSPVPTTRDDPAAGGHHRAVVPARGCRRAARPAGRRR